VPDFDHIVASSSMRQKSGRFNELWSPEIHHYSRFVRQLVLIWDPWITELGRSRSHKRISPIAFFDGPIKFLFLDCHRIVDPSPLDRLLSPL
jgi:hypothetical protein